GRGHRRGGPRPRRARAPGDRPVRHGVADLAAAGRGRVARRGRRGSDPRMTPDQLESASDAELLRAHVDGDPHAFGALFGRHRDRLWAVALRTMGNREDAADGLQDGMVAAYRRAGSYRGDAAVTTWLHRVVVNACLDRIRAAKVRRAEALPDDVDERGHRGSAG